MDHATRRVPLPEAGAGRPSFVRRALIAVGLAGLAVALGLLLWFGIQVLLVVFAGILLGVFLRGLTDLTSHYLRLSAGWSLALVVLALAALVIAAFLFMGATIASQVDTLLESLPDSISQLQEQLKSYPWRRRLATYLEESSQNMPQGGQLLQRASGFASATLGVVANMFIVLFIGLYLAYDPRVYTDGIVKLTPPASRPRARDVLNHLGETLWRWLLGRLFSMAVVSVLTAIGLWLLGIPLVLTLALIAAVLNFIPNIGPLLSAVPAMMLAFSQGPWHPLYVALLYLGVQTLESYLITPFVQQRMVSLPPVLIITAQVLFGVLFGFLGLLLATPIAASLLVLVQLLYIEDYLGDAEPQPAHS